MHFHLAHIVPSKTMHGLNGYKEVIDTIQWGLQQLGHQADYGLNVISPTATNIIFGAQLLDESVIGLLRPDTIFYNFEQMRGVPADGFKPNARIGAERFRIWDYSEANVPAWQSLGAKRLRIVPIGHAPVLERIPRAAGQDIDVLIYGSPGPDRLGAFHYLCSSGLTAMFVCGMYGKPRDELIGRAKVVLNMNVYDTSKIFEIVRVSYLLANRKAVLAVVEDDIFIDDDMRRAVRISTPAQLVDDCNALVNDKVARVVQEEAGYQVFTKRDIRDILRQALAP